MITYQRSPANLKTFCSPGKPFMAFNEFVDLVQWERDVYWAPDNVKGFEQDIGQAYNVWTRRSVSVYHRHIFPDELTDPVTIAFEVPHLDKNATFPLVVKIFDDHGLYFEHEQELALERLVSGRFILSSWKKVPKVREFLLSQVATRKEP
ncbi:hypothetical protein [Pseudorhodobacter sp. E13]|uniref:hypothetical protein n=1 Tax=Pseudorhodobacter sp. E13 TaxID=2487931 RepID=UPI000F8E42A6|nr:hypothetical protein [Pseudorhodobacter sp. E13]